jgi:N6-L-threonylcarbamoyladenine synthase
VLANTRLRARLAEEADARGVELYLPSPGLCTDNGAMIAAAAGFHLAQGARSGWDADVDPGLRLA